MATTFTVRPDGKLFLIEEIRADGSRIQNERYGTEDQARRRIKALYERDAGVAAANAKLSRKAKP